MTNNKTSITNKPLEMVGGWNESNQIHNLDRMGFTYPKSLGEIIANSIDAKASNIIIEINDDTILIYDNGEGMTLGQLKSMMTFNDSNHNDSQSMGISGVGFKISSKILSNNDIVYVYTKSNLDKNYLEGIIDWKTIIESGKYGNSIPINKTNSDLLKYNTGTTIKFPYNPVFHECLTNQFKQTQKKNQSITDDMRWIFGKLEERVSIQLVDNTNQNTDTSLEFYNPLNGDDKDFYIPITKHTIVAYQNRNYENKKDFVLETITNKENTYKTINYTETGKVSRNMKHYNDIHIAKKLGQFELIIGMRKEVSYFNPNNPICPGASAHGNGYNDKFYSKNDETIREELSKIEITRNGQRIGLGDYPTFSHGSARANRLSQLKYGHHIIVNVEYNINSTLDNDLDKIIGVQTNKNQLNSQNIPIEFRQLIEYLKGIYAVDIDSYIDQTIVNHKKIIQKYKQTLNSFRFIEKSEIKVTDGTIDEYKNLIQHFEPLNKKNMEIYIMGLKSEISTLLSKLKLDTQKYNKDLETGDLDKLESIKNHIQETLQKNKQFNLLLNTIFSKIQSHSENDCCTNIDQFLKEANTKLEEISKLKDIIKLQSFEKNNLQTIIDKFTKKNPTPNPNPKPTPTPTPTPNPKPKPTPTPNPKPTPTPTPTPTQSNKLSDSETSELKHLIDTVRSNPLYLKAIDLGMVSKLNFID